jgi:hypothetical protein
MSEVCWKSVRRSGVWPGFGVAARLWHTAFVNALICLYFSQEHNLWSARRQCEANRPLDIALQDLGRSFASPCPRDEEVLLGPSLLLLNQPCMPQRSLSSWTSLRTRC